MRRTTSHCMALYLPQASQQLQGSLLFVSNCFRFLTGCATDPAPPQPPQHHFELPSSQTFDSIAVRRQRTGSTRHLTKRLTTSRQSSTQRTFGVWRTNFQCRFDSFSTFTFFLHFGSNFHFLIFFHCSTTQRSQRGNLSKSCECFPRCSPLLEVEMLHSGETMMFVEKEEIVFDGDVMVWDDDGH